MSPRAKTDPDAPPPASERDTQVVVGDTMPSDAELLEDTIDKRFKALLSMTTDPKDLTKALEAATKWWEVKSKMKEGEGYGTGLRRTIGDGGRD